jgi:hypothetical protein
MQQKDQRAILRPGNDGVKPNAIYRYKHRFSFHSQSRERAPGHLVHVTGQGQSLSLTLPDQPCRSGGGCARGNAKQ